MRKLLTRKEGIGMIILTSILAIGSASILALIIGIIIGRMITLQKAIEAILDADDYIPQRYSFILDKIIEKL